MLRHHASKRVGFSPNPCFKPEEFKKKKKNPYQAFDKYDQKKKKKNTSFKFYLHGNRKEGTFMHLISMNTLLKNPFL